ncbi:MAG: hydroxymethylpyrimidine/phosphomethylpyrimidine kinase [Candidatus Muproteobacteria bacterium RIFCSPHIGHO2_01_60_12]|nr:MAG: hydroxymethylpyrimidine/phosphomethylpyrimidine kinase [Candidatus Muproteobacteria bacterium RIFCSPHIGHO2_01_60_12]
MSNASPPVVLVFAGTDPTGGAGVTADVLTLASLGCHPAVVVTAVTAQDTTGIKQFTCMDTELVIAQARAVLEDMPVAAFKIGMLGSSAVAATVASIVEDYPDIPLIVDPVQTSGRGDALADDMLDGALRSLIIPQTTLITPNSIEARALAPGADTLDACAQELMSLGSEFVLITGTHENTPQVLHRLYGNMRLLETYVFERLPGSFHGSGCTLASACAASLAHGLDPVNAVGEALRYTWETLKHGFRPGMGQPLPNRLYWAWEMDEPEDGEG